MAKIFKYISQIFVVKEREMEIGFPTDVKHVAHIGWDGPSDSAPSWMNEFKNAPDFSTLGRNNNNDRRDSSSNAMSSSPWASQDYDQSSMGRQPSTNLIDLTSNDANIPPKKPKRKKIKSSSSSSSSSRSSRPSKTSKATYAHMEPTPNLLI